MSKQKTCRTARICRRITASHFHLDRHALDMSLQRINLPAEMGRFLGAEMVAVRFRSVPDMNEGCSASGGRRKRLGMIGNSVYRVGRSYMCSG